MSAALVNRSLATLKTELEFLRESNVITENFYNQVTERLPDRYKQGDAPIDVASSFQQPSNPTPIYNNEKQNHSQQTIVSQSSFKLPPQPPIAAQHSNEEFVEAIYDYKPHQAEDLELRVGDKIKVLEHTSADWWRGSSHLGTGMFPSNYVSKIENRNKPPSPAPSYQQTYTQQSNFSGNSYGNPPYQQQHTVGAVSYQQQQPPAQVYVQAEQQQAQQQPQQQPQQQHHLPHGVKRFGSKLGNAAIFGAGATIGSDIVNSIF